ncbi:hypothetical protein BB021_04365 [Elizabethkingia ursingii]|uniref:Molybdenum ABC transporter permease n=1 Tax=Elizabethkingia ursingii TaxID=1756150 RepID=A0ABX3NA20_9FLAO|nr:hypothetical protein BB021_04365 [Elizabethkingia ursingii]
MVASIIIFIVGILLLYLRIKNKFPYNNLYDKNDEDYIYDIAVYMIRGWMAIIGLIVGGIYGIIVNLLKII